MPPPGRHPQRAPCRARGRESRFGSNPADTSPHTPNRDRGREAERPAEDTRIDVAGPAARIRGQGAARVALLVRVPEPVLPAHGGREGERGLTGRRGTLPPAAAPWAAFRRGRRSPDDRAPRLCRAAPCPPPDAGRLLLAGGAHTALSRHAAPRREARGRDRRDGRDRARDRARARPAGGGAGPPVPEPAQGRAHRGGAPGLRGRRHPAHRAGRPGPRGPRLRAACGAGDRARGRGAPRRSAGRERRRLAAALRADAAGPRDRLRREPARPLRPAPRAAASRRSCGGPGRGADRRHLHPRLAVHAGLPLERAARRHAGLLPQQAREPLDRRGAGPALPRARGADGAPGRGREQSRRRGGRR